MIYPTKMIIYSYLTFMFNMDVEIHRQGILNICIIKQFTKKIPIAV